MKYLMIENKGKIEVNAFALLGASTKRNDPSKIGFFGSGGCYALAGLFAHQIPFKIFSGTDSMNIYTEKERLGNSEFDAIKIEFKGKVKETGITTTAGPKWEPWFVIREFYCNALDEGEAVKKVVDESEITGIEGKTRIYMGMTPEISKVIDHWNAYFTNDRLSEPAKVNDLKLWPKYDGYLRIYRKGILVHVSEKPETSLFDYDLEEADIDESRVLRGIYGARWDIDRKISKYADSKTIRELLIYLSGHYKKDTHCFERGMDLYNSITENKVAWLEAVKGLIIVNYQARELFKDIIGRNDTILVNDDICKKLTKIKGEDNTFDIKGMKGDNIKQEFYEPRMITIEEAHALREAVSFLHNVGFEMHDIKIEVAEMHPYHIMGVADIPNRKIYIGKSAFDMGKKQIAATIVEEISHVISGFKDETRSFQDYLINSFLSYMEKTTGHYM